MEKFDVIIIGGGPGGYVAAIKASQLGLKTALIEKEHLGGICLNWGCIPTKALLKSAELLQKIKHAEEFGITTERVMFDIQKIVNRSRSISAQLVAGIKALLKKNKVTIFEGSAKISNPKLVLIENEDKKTSLETKNIIIATGSRAKILEDFKADCKNIWTYREALIPTSVPKSMVIVGAGAIGIEFASFYNALGVQVTVLEAASQILPMEDEEISVIAKKTFQTQGIKFYTSIKLEKKEISNNSVRVAFLQNNTKILLEAEVLLMAVGITANIENLGLENTNIKLESGHIATNGVCQTSETNIYAIGDVAGTPWLAHKASHEGIIAVEHIAGKNPHELNKLNIPSCTYSMPQIASVGMTEKSAISAGYKLKIGRFPFYANGKALILGDSNGLIKTIFDAKTGELLGAHLVGSDVTELIHSYVIAKSMEGIELDFIKAILPHPTLSEMLQESVLQAYNKAIHI